MGKGATQTHLAAYLADRYGELRLIDESVGKSLWRGRGEQAQVAIHCFPDWALQENELQALLERFEIVQQVGLTSLPTALEAVQQCDHLILVEQWVEGANWSEAVLSRESALENGAELFDLLDEIQERSLIHGRITEKTLIQEESSGRLKLVGLLSATLPAPESSSELSDLGDALRLVAPHLTPQELDKLKALTSGKEIARRIGRMLSSVTPEKSEPDFVGRDRYLNRLNRAFQEGGLITVEAPAGGGKSRLLKEWTDTLEARILRAKAAREVAPSPLQLFSGPLQAIEAELNQKPEMLSRLNREMGLTLPLRNSLSTSNQLQRSAFVWLTKLLEGIQLERPTILILEDVHWADELTLAFLQHWQKEGGRTLVVASFRADELAPDHVLAGLRCPRISLPLLTRNQAARLLRSAQPGASETLIESAIQRAEGNPFLLLQFLRSGRVQGDLQQARLSGLNQATLSTLATAAVLGDEFRAPLLEHCLGQPASLEEGLAEGLLESRSQGFCFVHDRLRETFLATLEADQLKTIHQRAAEYLAANEPVDPFRVAYHYQAAGRPESGRPFAETAALRARENHDLSTAVYYLLAALAGLESRGGEAEESLLTQLGDCYRLLGRYRASEECFHRALLLTTQADSKAQIKLALGDVYFKQAELERARDALVEGLELLGDGQPRWLTGSFAKKALGLVFRSILPLKKSPGDARRDLLKASLYNRLAYVGWFLEGPIASVRAHLCELQLAEPYGDTPQLARALANHAMAMSAIPWWSRALRYGKESLAVARRVGDRWSEGQGGHFYGAALLGAGRLREARAVLREAQRVLEQTGDRWEENGVSYHLALTYYRLGALDQATALAKKTQRIGVELNDRLAAGDNLYTWARACDGLMEREALEVEKTFSSPDLQRACELLSAEAVLDLRDGLYQDAVEKLRQAALQYRLKKVQNLYSANIPCWLATAYRLSAQEKSGQARLEALRQAQSTARRACRVANRYPTNLPHAWRELGLAHLLLGSHLRARESLLASRQVAIQGELKQERQITENLLHHFAWALGPPPPDSRAEGDSHLWLLGQGQKSRKTESPLGHLLRAATDISRSLSVPTALYRLWQGCKLLWGQDLHCSVVARGDSERWELLCGDPFQETGDPRYSGDWWSFSLPFLDRTALLLLRKGENLPEDLELLTDFLVTVAVAVVDRAGHTASSTSLSRDLRHSTALLDQEAGRLFQAREQLLLSERLALTGRLATGLLHDLGNLVLAITGGTEMLLLDFSPDDPRRRDLNEILQAGRKSRQLLTHLSGLTRGDILGSQPLDINKRIAETRPLLRSLCGPIVELEFEFEGQAMVHIDPIILDRLLLNLVMNARDAVKPGGVIEITTRTRHLEAPLEGFPCQVPAGTFHEIAVSDDGAGIPAEVLPRVFELHFTTKGDRGTGVGLASVLEMVTQSSGYIILETSPRGTTLRTFLPPL